MVRNNLLNLIQEKAVLEIQQAKLKEEHVRLVESVRSLGQQIGEKNRAIMIQGLERETELKQEYQLRFTKPEKKVKKKG